MKSCRKAASIGLLPNSYSVIDIYICFVAAVSLVGLVCSVGAYGSDSECYNFTDFSVYGWGSQGVSSWYRDDSTGHNSSTSLRSGLIECNGFSGVYRYVPAPAEIQFWWKSDTTIERGGKLIFVVDGEERLVCSADGWEKEVYPMYSGGEIGWEFRKIKCYPQDKGSGWIDDICITYAAPRNESVVGPGVGWPQYNGTAGWPVGGVIETGIININASEIRISTPSVAMGQSSVATPPINITVNPVIEIPEIVVPPANVTVSPCLGNITISSIPDLTISSNCSAIRVIPSSRPVVRITEPQDCIHVDVKTPIDFGYIAYDDDPFLNCTLCINGNRTGSCETIETNSSEDYSIEYQFSNPGEYNWSVECCDGITPCSKPIPRKIIVNSERVNVTSKSDINHYNYSSISAALENVTSGGTVVVYKKQCGEKVVINRPVNLTGLGRPLMCDRNFNNRSDDGVVIINSNDVLIDGFDINGRTRHNSTLYRKHTVISTRGTILKNITISNSTIRGGQHVIHISHCDNISIRDVNISDIIESGIYISNSCNISVINNSIKGEKNSHIRCGIYIEWCEVDIDKIYDNNISYADYCIHPNLQYALDDSLKSVLVNNTYCLSYSSGVVK